MKSLIKNILTELYTPLNPLTPWFKRPQMVYRFKSIQVWGISGFKYNIHFYEDLGDVNIWCSLFYQEYPGVENNYCLTVMNH